MSYNRKTILMRCQRLNSRLEEKNIKAEITLVGGSALAFDCNDARRSVDIDAHVNNTTSTDISELLDEALIDTNVSLVASVPDFNDCKTLLVKEYSNLVVNVLDITELAVTKLFTKRAKDLDDLVVHILPNIPDDDIITLREMIREYVTYYVGDLEAKDLNLNSVMIEKYRLK